jgi:SAM-dependent methyltransferase
MYGPPVNAAAASMLEVLAYIEAELARGAQTISLDVLDPDLATGKFAGELVDGLVHRPLRVWIDLAERLRLRLRTPARIDHRMLRLTFERLVIAAPARVDAQAVDAPVVADTPDARRTEKYGAMSEFARIRKLEDPTFVIDLREALERVLERAQGSDPSSSILEQSQTSMRAPTTRVGTGTGAVPIRVLDLGVNTGDELELVLRMPELREAEIIGVDHSASAIAVARERFAPNPNVRFVEADIAQLARHAGTPETASLGRFDLVVCIGTLQSGAIDDRELLRTIVQDHLAPGGAVILGMPNCRYVDGELEYGARIVNITQPELGLLVKDVAFYRKYLQQHHKKVFVTGKHYLLVTAVAT